MNPIIKCVEFYNDGKLTGAINVSAREDHLSMDVAKFESKDCLLMCEGFRMSFDSAEKLGKILFAMAKAMKRKKVMALEVKCEISKL